MKKTKRQLLAFGACPCLSRARALPNLRSALACPLLLSLSLPPTSVHFSPNPLSVPGILDLLSLSGRLRAMAGHPRGRAAEAALCRGRLLLLQVLRPEVRPDGPGPAPTPFSPYTARLGSYPPRTISVA